MKNCDSCYRAILVDEYRLELKDGEKDWVYCGLCEDVYNAHVEEIENPDRLAGTEKVQVKNVPVRYKGRRYFEGEEVNIDPTHFDADVFEKI